MTMPHLDPNRYRVMRLLDLTHTVPMPGSARLFSQTSEGEVVDMHDPFWMAVSLSTDQEIGSKTNGIGLLAP